VDSRQYAPGTVGDTGEREVSVSSDLPDDHGPERRSRTLARDLAQPQR